MFSFIKLMVCNNDFLQPRITAGNSAIGVIGSRKREYKRKKEINHSLVLPTAIAIDIISGTKNTAHPIRSAHAG